MSTQNEGLSFRMLTLIKLIFLNSKPPNTELF